MLAIFRLRAADLMVKVKLIERKKLLGDPGDGLDSLEIGDTEIIVTTFEKERNAPDDRKEISVTEYDEYMLKQLWQLYQNLQKEKEKKIHLR